MDEKYEIVLVNEEENISIKEAKNECWLDLCSPDNCEDECGVDFAG